MLCPKYYRLQNNTNNRIIIKQNPPINALDAPGTSGEMEIQKSFSNIARRIPLNDFGCGSILCPRRPQLVYAGCCELHYGRLPFTVDGSYF